MYRKLLFVVIVLAMVGLLVGLAGCPQPPTEEAGIGISPPRPPTAAVPPAVDELEPTEGEEPAVEEELTEGEEPAEEAEATEGEEPAEETEATEGEVAPE